MIVFTIMVSPDDPTWRAVFAAAWTYAAMQPHDPAEPRQGEQCGPVHHWAYVRSGVQDPDLSCEAD
jgi:hypothetical protein